MRWLSIIEEQRKLGCLVWANPLLGVASATPVLFLEQDSTTAIPSGLIGPGGMGLSVQDILAVFVRDDDGA